MISSAPGDPHLVIAAGGTGGHMFPAQALAQEMLRRGWRVSLSTDDRGLRYAGGFPEAVVRREVRAATFARGGAVEKLAAPFRIARGASDAMAWLKADPAAVVVGFGGYPSLPALTAAWRLGAPRVIHEQNGVLGRVNRIFATRVDLLACGVWPVANAPAAAPLKHIGNPIRDAVRAHVGTAYAPPSAQGPFHVLVVGGSQGAAVFSDSLPPALAGLPTGLKQRLRVTQQARAGTEAEVEAVYKAAGVAAEIAPFFDDLPDRLATTHLVVARAGASTIAELTAIGRPSLLAPLPTATGDHQNANARALSEAGGAEVLTDASLGEALPQRLSRLAEDPAALVDMAEAARRLGRPQAGHDLADAVAEVATAGRET